jgi:hypothetical protein
MSTIQCYPDELDYVNAKLRIIEGSFSFVEEVCRACLRADGENYEVVRPLLHHVMRKYPVPTELLTFEARDRVARA